MQKPSKKTETGLKIPSALRDQIGCFNCAKTSAVGGGKLKVCSGCGLAAYCGSACQKEGWPGHKMQCQTTRANFNKDRGEGEKRILFDKAFGGAYSACAGYWTMDHGDLCVVADLSHPAVAYCEARDTSDATSDADKRKITLSFVKRKSREMVALENQLAAGRSSHSLTASLGVIARST